MNLVLGDVLEKISTVVVDPETLVESVKVRLPT